MNKQEDRTQNQKPAREAESAQRVDIIDGEVIADGVCSFGNDSVAARVDAELWTRTRYQQAAINKMVVNKLIATISDSWTAEATNHQ